MANNRNSRRDDGVGMVSPTKCFWSMWMAVICGCLVLAGALRAQTGSAGGTTPDPSSAEPVASAKAHDATYIIGNDDVLSVNVWKEQEVSRITTVRSDGKISLPLAGELQAAGRTPEQLEGEIASKLKNFISEPEVTVIVQEIKSRRINVLGLVTKPGAYPLTNSMTVLDAIALSGGFRDFAKQKSIYVLRTNPDGTQARLSFNYKDVVKGKNPEQNIKLQPRDTVVIP